MMKEDLNPFNMEDKKHIFNLATGTSVSKETENFLLNIVKIGNAEQTMIFDDCIECPARFHKKIKQQVLKMFAIENGRMKVTVKDGKLSETCLIRDLFCSILYISSEQKVGMAEVLSYPLTSVPLPSSHVDGTMK